MSFDSFSMYQLDTPNMLGGQNAQSSHDNFQLSPFDTCQVPGMIQYQMDMQQDLQEDEEPKSNPRPKLGYKRASSACKQCRHRKIRCIASSSDAQARCVSCVRLKKECSSYLTGRSSADGSDLIRVARFSPSTDGGSDAYDLAQTSASMEQYLDIQKPPLDSSKTRATASVAPIGNGISWADDFASGMRVEGQVNLNMRSQSLPEWDAAVMGHVSNANAVDFDSDHRGQLSEVPAISHFPPPMDMSIPSTSSIPQHANPLSQADLNFSWGSNSYALPIRSLSGMPETVNNGNMVHVGGDAVFDFQSSPSPGTNQPFPLQITLAAQGRSQSLPYNGYTFDSFWE
ncbi:hypothetical protein FVEG_15317 [Fusarium verticillioides 7600]|uniref:Zn(2)-C6 fungal-type domain-containing protein n=1 Tax=Gibberella moniliformis (strain M3125 / FGSC 7600) TaxID=334819 RepID=W7M9L2_GIBM7|nr:hypothetical protein FVEG_15317 [Fusarium verticillioides 7600]EWG41607.1 hypothetical protein FVEG_15317 [Fusarium verticillioides 7600]RBQ89322.1 hypothetical protein FVER53263_20057 [Fusarium verticillioides]